MAKFNAISISKYKPKPTQSELAYYKRETAMQVDAFSRLVSEACGAGATAFHVLKLLLSSTSGPATAGRVYGPEAALVALVVQAWMSRIELSAHLATPEQVEHAEQCTSLIVSQLRFFAAAAIRKAARHDD